MNEQNSNNKTTANGAKAPFTITRYESGMLELRVGDVRKNFANEKTLEQFALDLYSQASLRMTSTFRLQDCDEGRVDIIFNRGGDVIHARSLEQVERFAEGIIAELSKDKD